MRYRLPAGRGVVRRESLGLKSGFVLLAPVNAASFVWPHTQSMRKMAIPKPPTPLSEEELEALETKFADHEISDEQRARQEKYRDKLESAD